MVIENKMTIGEAVAQTRKKWQNHNEKEPCGFCLYSIQHASDPRKKYQCLDCLVPTALGCLCVDLESVSKYEDCPSDENAALVLADVERVAAHLGVK